MGSELLVAPLEAGLDGGLSIVPLLTRVPPSWGGVLTQTDYEELAKSWIDSELADLAQLRRVDAAEGREVIGQKGNRDCSGILIPFYYPESSHAHSYRLRRDNHEWKLGKDGVLKADRKYLGEPGSGNRLYFPPGIQLSQLADTSTPIVITEGEKKALSLQRLANFNVDRPRFIPIAISGVWNWRGTIGKAEGPKGERVDVQGPINDLNRIEWKQRTVYIVFDANVATNDSVKWARNGISRELAGREAVVRCINLPVDCGVNGVDDLLSTWGPKRVLELFEKPTDATVIERSRPTQFQSRPDGMVRISTRGDQPVAIPLSNFLASIITNLMIDDGLESKREFELECELSGRAYKFTIPASRFAQMDWAIEQMGAHAIIFPNQKDYARAAIQCFSMDAEERNVYAHTGWRKIDGTWNFLHAGGAVDASGEVAGVNVRLPGSLELFKLLLPESNEEEILAVRSSLFLVEGIPPSIGFPILAAVFRAVLGDADFALHLAGETGAFKSELASVAQQFFGVGMNRKHLPGSWSSTANALEALVFHAKDVLVGIDDFAPQGNVADVARYHAAADRVFRAAGNQAGRGRLDSTAQLREPKPPRGLILSTGEEIPRGHSIRARLFILELSKGMISPSALTAMQAAAQSGDYARALGGFVRWLAGRLDEARTGFEQRVNQLRLNALGNTAHARTPDIVSSLQAAFEMFVEFAQSCGAVDSSLAEKLAAECWRALLESAIAQSKHHAASEPAARFVSLLGTCLSSGRAHLASKEGAEPKQSPEDCGWRRDGHVEYAPKGSCIGWTDGGDVFIEPAAAYQVVQLACRDMGEAIPVSEHMLRKRLREKGYLASTDEKRETITVRRILAGSQKNVLHFLRDTILPTGQRDESE